MSRREVSLPELLRRIKLVVSDVDGVLTDGAKFYDRSGLAILMFNARDGLGAVILKLLSIEIALVTSTQSSIIEQRANDLGIKEIKMGIWQKGPAVRDLREGRNLSFDEVMYIGDDVWDLSAFREVGIKVAVHDAHPKLIEGADWVTRHRGGSGAFREVADAIAAARGLNVKNLVDMLESASCKEAI